MSQSSEDIESSGDGVRVLMLSAGGGTLGTGGTGERARVADVRDTAEVVRCRAVSRTEPPHAAAPRDPAVSVRREDTEVVGGEVGRRGVVDCAGDVAGLVRWRGVGGLRLATLFGADVVRARGTTRVVVRLLTFASCRFVLRVDPDTVRWRTLFPGTDNVGGDAWLAGLDRTERREGGLLTGVVEIGGGEGVVVLSVARPLFAFMAGVVGSAAEKTRTQQSHLAFSGSMRHTRRLICKYASYGCYYFPASEGCSRIDALSDRRRATFWWEFTCLGRAVRSRLLQRCRIGSFGCERS